MRRHGEKGMPVEIRGELPRPLDGMVRQALCQALGGRPQEFVIHISRPYAEMIVDIRKPCGKKLKFNHPQESEIARELFTTVTAIVDEEFGPIKKS